MVSEIVKVIGTSVLVTGKNDTCKVKVESADGRQHELLVSCSKYLSISLGDKITVDLPDLEEDRGQIKIPPPPRGRMCGAGGVY